MNTRQACLERLRGSYREIPPGQTYQVDLFRPEDAPGVAQLYYAVYGENFPVDYVYDPEELVRRNAGPDLHHVLARTPSGDIVAMAALFRSAPGQGIMESGSLMALPNYPGGKLVLSLGQIIHDLPQRLGLHAVFCQNVCDHLVSQKASQRFHYRPFSLELDAMPPRPKEQAPGQGGRISLLDEFRVYRDAPHTVHLPDVYAGFLSSLYASRGLSRVQAPDAEPGSSARFDVQAMDHASLVRVNVLEFGRDFPQCLRQTLERFPDRQVCQLCLPLWQPGITLAVNAARSARFFMAGLLPLWADRDMLLMQRLATSSDRSRIKLFTGEAVELLDFISRDQEAVTR